MSNRALFEVEVKFQVDDLGKLRQAVQAAGAVIKKARVFERNIRYDDAAGNLLAAQSVLRLRFDTVARITWKALPTDLALLQSEAKVREEIEIEVSDFDSADLIIQRLGYIPTQTYEKYRETFQLDDVEIVLDELPYGNFVELEGPEPTIRALAQTLHLDWQQRILFSYLALLAQFNTDFDTRIKDLTFANFAPHSAFIAQFQAIVA